MPRLTPERTTGLPANRCGFADVDVGREDHGIGAVDDVAGKRLVAARALRLDDQVDAGLLAGRRQRVGRHEGVGDARGARGDGDDAAGRAVDAERRREADAAAGAAGCSRCGGGSGIALADRVADDRDDLVGGRGGAQARGEVVLHEAAGELREHREVRLGSTLGGGDEEHEVGGAVRRTEVDAGLQPREGERRGR